MLGRKKQDDGGDQAAKASSAETSKVMSPEPEGPMPPAYLGSSIIVILLCMPLGLIALYWGLKVRVRYGHGDEQGAAKASKSAEMFMFAGVGAFVILLIIGGIVLIVRAITGD